ncbi:MAG: hypothetical protein AAFO77_11015, partial [Pseudomonadota bacterium]
LERLARPHRTQRLIFFKERSALIKRGEHPMSNSKLSRRGALAAFAGLLVSGCVVVDAPPPGGGGGGGNEPPPPPPPSTIRLSPGEFKGFDGSGTRQRVRIRSAGNGYTLQTLTGRNGGQVFYVDQGRETYRAADGSTMQVSSPRSFVWNGPRGRIAMND